MRPLRAAALLLLATGCSTTAPHGLVRVDLPGPVSGPGSPEESQLEAAVREAAAAEGLACQPGQGSMLLRCTAAALGSQTQGLTVLLVRSGTGYQVSIDQSIRLAGSSSPVCSVQSRMREHLDTSLQAPVARVDARSDCREK